MSQRQNPNKLHSGSANRSLLKYARSCHLVMNDEFSLPIR